jgi:histidine ammonia-lyase/phenylalanine ammonia-lyase
MGFTAAKMTRAVLPLLWKLVAIEAMAMVQAADMHPRKDVMGGDYRKLYDLVRSVSAPLQTDRPLADEIGRVMVLLQSEAAQKQCLAPDAPS